MNSVFHTPMCAGRPNLLGLSLLVAVASCRDLAGFSDSVIFADPGAAHDTGSTAGPDGAHSGPGAVEGGDAGVDVGLQEDSGVENPETGSIDDSGIDDRIEAGGTGGSSIDDSGTDGWVPDDGTAGPNLDADLVPEVVVVNNARFGPTCTNASTTGGAVCSELPGAPFSSCSGGASDTSPGMVLAAFDNTEAGCPWVGQGAGPCYWAASLPPLVNIPYTGGFVSQAPDDFDPCSSNPGSLRFRAEFVPYNEAPADTFVRTRVVFNHDHDLTGRAKLHLWLKLQIPAPTVERLMVYISSSSAGGPSGAVSDWNNLSVSSLSDGLWHEVIYTLTGASYLSSINQIGVSVYPVGNMSPEPTARPDAAVIYIDNVWVE